jgi:hypothetical protein
MKFLLGYILHLANSDIPFLHKDKFYVIKTKFLKKYGTFICNEIQHIKKECYRCNSEGVYRSKFKLSEPCWSCLGTGVYDEFWVRLEKYKLGNFYFHNPIQKSRTILFEGVSKPIEGYIEHKAPKYRIGKEAALWLFLFFDFNTFKSAISIYGHPSHKRTPLVFLGNLIWKIRCFDIKKLIPKKKQKYCYIDNSDLPF